MSTWHIVSFQIAGGEPAIAKLVDLFLPLEHTCQRPSGEKVIKSVKGGRQVSKEGFDKGVLVVWILEFANDDDLQYYLWTDPAHEAFKQSLKQFEKVQPVVLDFQDGVYSA